MPRYTCECCGMEHMFSSQGTKQPAPRKCGKCTRLSKIRIMHGTCQCIDDWRKPKSRILKHLAEFGPEICPHCDEEINWCNAPGD